MGAVGEYLGLPGKRTSDPRMATRNGDHAWVWGPVGVMTGHVCGHGERWRVAWRCRPAARIQRASGRDWRESSGAAQSGEQQVRGRDRSACRGTGVPPQGPPNSSGAEAWSMFSRLGLPVRRASMFVRAIGFGLVARKRDTGPLLPCRHASGSESQACGTARRSSMNTLAGRWSGRARQSESTDRQVA